MKLTDLAAVQQIVQTRDNLARVARGLDKARTFRVVMATTESGDVTCELPSTFAGDVRSLIEKQLSSLDNELRGYGVEP